jgi:hypothetical protein
LGKGLTQHLSAINSLLRNVAQGHGNRWILWNGLGNGRDHLEDLDVDGKIIFKMDLRE